MVGAAYPLLGGPPPGGMELALKEIEQETESNPLAGKAQQIKGILLGTMSGHPLGVHSSNFTFAEFGQG